MLRGAIFDMDGTIVDSMSLWESLGELYLTKKGITPPADLLDTLWDMSLEEMARYFQDKYQLTDDIETIKAEAIAFVEEEYVTNVPAKPGIKEFLDEFVERQIPMVIASTGYPKLIVPTLERLGLRPYFSEIFTCTQLGTTKREPLIYYACAGFLGFEEGQIAVFEDVIHAVQTAKTAGFLTVGIEDATSAKDKDEIIKLSDYYLADYQNTAAFWQWAEGLKDIPQIYQ